MGRDTVWSKVITFSMVIFFIRLADAIISFWAPNLLQNTFHNSFIMGLIIALQSVIGVGADFIFPSLLKKSTISNFIIWSIIASFMTTIFLLFASFRPILLLFLISMIIWGIYYELASFGTTEFVAKNVSKEKRTGAWGIIGAFISTAYFVGPIIAALFIVKGQIILSILIFIFLLCGLLVFLLTSKKSSSDLGPIISDFKPLQEIREWMTLSKVLWPVIAISLTLGAIDATFWTTGAVFTEKLTKTTPLGNLLLPFYTLPTLFMGFLVLKWGIYNHKKKWAEIFLLISSIFLIALVFSNSIIWILANVLIASIAISVSIPLVDGVYTDIAVRLGKVKKHEFGLVNSIVNVSYIIWPPIAGIIADAKGEKIAFVYLGIFALIISIILLIVTPKKLKLPQTEIGEWKE